MHMRKSKQKHDLSLYNLLARNSPFSWKSLFAFVVLMKVSTALLIMGKITSNDWVQMAQWIGGFFITGEAARKFAGGKKEEDPPTV